MNERKVSHSLMFKHRGWLGIVSLVPIGLAVVFSYPLVQEGAFIDFFMDLLGWLCFVLYVTFRIWSTLFVGGRKDSVLQTEGPYSVTRNPLYFGSFCLALSVTLLLRSVSLLLATLILSLLYTRRVITVEEEVLERLFGDTYRAYAKRTPRLIPNFSLYRAPDSIVVNLKEIKREAVRLWFASLLPLLAEIVMNVRTSPRWPHWFTLP